MKTLYEAIWDLHGEIESLATTRTTEFVRETIERAEREMNDDSFLMQQNLSSSQVGVVIQKVKEAMGVDDEE